MLTSRSVFMAIFFLTAAVQGYCYIDPGTGSLLVSSLLGIGVAVLYSLRGFIYSMWNRITGKKIILDNNFEDKIVFFNEGENYWNVFYPVIKEFIDRKKHFVYLTASENDPGLELDSKYIQAHCLGNINKAILFLNNIKADTVVMTTPQLNILHLKRSKKVRHYCHLLHAPVDIHTYKRFAFDYFDSVLCTSSYQIENLRQLERDRNSKEKMLYETGCTYYDCMDVQSDGGGEAILLAPTWGEKSFFRDNGEKLIEKILKTGNTLIYRPHPQSWVSDKELLNKVLARFSDDPKFIVDKSVSNIESLKKAKLMICDLSGIIYDFTFLYNKPVIAVRRDNKNGGYEETDVKNDQSAIDLLNDTGICVTADKLLNFSSVLDSISRKKITKAVIDKHIYNFKKAGKAAAGQILEIYNTRGQA